MLQGISEVLPFAVGVAIVPVPVIAVILILFSRRARANGPLFLLGWVAGLSTAFVVVYALADAADVDSEPSAADSVSWGRLGLGALLLLLAARTWRRRPRQGDDAAMPGWMTGIDELTPVKTLGLGVVLSAANPKNLVLVAGAAAGLAQLGLAAGDALVALVAFVVVGSLGVAGPVTFFLVGGDRATRSLEELKGWLTLHNAAVMAVLLLVFGVVLVSNALGGLGR